MTNPAAINRLTIAFAACFLLLARIHGQRLFFIGEGDDESYFAYAHTLWVNHNLDFSKEPLPTFEGNPHAQIQAARYAIGSGILWMPFLAVGHTAQRFMPDSAPAGIAPLEWAFVCLGSVLYGFAGLLFFYLILRQFFTPDVSALAVSIALLGSPWTYYVFRRPLMSHSGEFFILAAAFYAVSRLSEKNNLSHILASAAVTGFLFLCRWTDAPYVATLALWSAWALPGKTRRWINIRSLLMAFVIGLVASVQLMVWKHLSGHWYPGIRLFDVGIMKSSVIFAWYPWTFTHLKDLWIGSDWGILWLSPTLWMAAPGAWLIWRHSGASKLLFFLVFPTAVSFLIASNWPSHGGDYGNRYLIPTWLLWGLLIAESLRFARTKGRACWNTTLGLSLGLLALSLLLLSVFKSNAGTLTLHVGPTVYGLPSDWVNPTYAREAYHEIFRHPVHSLETLASAPAGYMASRVLTIESLNSYFTKHTPPPFSFWMVLILGGTFGLLFIRRLALKASHGL